MNYGPLIFLAGFFALASSWFGFVLIPQVQLGNMQQTNTIVTSATYPLARPGLARQGLDVYRANGCAYCHSQQVEQTGTIFEVSLADAGTNQSATLAALQRVKLGTTEEQAKEVISKLPAPILRSADRGTADAAAKALNATGAKAVLWIVPIGPDIARGWGKRRSVAEDFLFDYPVMTGSQRIGPDLANIGVRQPDINWHLRHLYEPRLEVKESPMPRYRFLFEKRKIERVASPEALPLSGKLAPPAGYEIVPKPEAKALAAYLISLRADAPLFSAPLTVAGGTSAATDTNTPAAPDMTSTNAAPTNSPAK